MVDQPMKDDPELGKGWDLAAGEVGGAIGSAVETLMQRLGKNADFGITRYLKAFGESRDSFNDRILEKKEAELATLETTRAAAVESLNSVAPLVEELKKIEDKIRDTKAESKRARDRKNRAASWKELRNRWVARNGEYASQKRGDRKDKGNGAGKEAFS